ncbi:hypothetical protein B0H66DRAFT_623074 [Apodospora peruviana]|uniref:Uncharacterized protein n=1 Tax=Apodospora peruviana TaxID=516989 RepID=A0AAE0I5J2_9PEZI|nr:hypothetical protein B0H66DRAFT_623074 [Apodospora peruviana]
MFSKTKLSLSPLLPVTVFLSTFPLASATADPYHNSTFGEDNFGWDNFKTFSGGIGPWGFPAEDWDSYIDKHANATGFVRLRGPNILQPFSSSGPSSINVTTSTNSGWAWQIAVSNDVPVVVDGLDETNTSTGVRIKLNTPFDADGADDSWQLCITEWRPTGRNYSSRLRFDDGTCGSVLSEQCIKDIEAQAVDSAHYRTNIASDLTCQCVDPSTIASCEGSDFPLWSSCTARTFTAEHIRGWENGKLNFLSYGGPPHPAGDIMAYNMTGSFAWPLMVTWGRAPDGNETEPHPGEVNATASLACVRADEAADGSRVPGEPVAMASSGHRSLEMMSSPIVFIASLVGACMIMF